MYDLDYSDSLSKNYVKQLMLLNELEKESPSCFAKVYDYGLIHFGERETEVGKQKYVVYYSILEKLYAISEDEKKVFHTILSHEDSGKIKKFSSKELGKILFNLRRGLDFSEEEVKLFHTNLQATKIRHCDIAPRNIMKNKLGKFKLIDFDRMEINE